MKILPNLLLKFGFYEFFYFYESFDINFVNRDGFFYIEKKNIIILIISLLKYQ
jgi:hypothetical protein